MREAQTKDHLPTTPHGHSVSRSLAAPALPETFSRLVTLRSVPRKGIAHNLAVDASGLSPCRCVRWFNKQDGRALDNREWVNVHRMCGVETKRVTRGDVSGWMANDTPSCVPLLERTATYCQVRDVSAEKASLSHKNLQAAPTRAAMPCIPCKVPTAVPKTNAIGTEMSHDCMENREECVTHSHQRSNVETACSMIKAQFGDAGRSKSAIGPLHEGLCKVLCHHLCVLIQAIHARKIAPTCGAEGRLAPQSVEK